MARIPKSNGSLKIDLDDIILLDNVRKNYDEIEIEQRARSIERDGQLSPIGLTSQNELIFGYCRYYAFKLLVSENKPYSQIKYEVHSGDIEILQLTENIQRLDLNSEEIESGLKKMANKGMKPKQISERLNKSISWVCDSLKAGEIREEIETLGVNTTGISSPALSATRNIPKKNLKKAVENIKKNGGTVSAAKNESRQYNTQKKETNLSKGEKVIVQDEYMNIPKGKYHFDPLYSALKVLRRLDYTNENIINKAKEYLEELK